VAATTVRKPNEGVAVVVVVVVVVLVVVVVVVVAAAAVVVGIVGVVLVVVVVVVAAAVVVVGIVGVVLGTNGPAGPSCTSAGPGGARGIAPSATPTPPPSWGDVGGLKTKTVPVGKSSTSPESLYTVVSLVIIATSLPNM
jgi:hypothetical protein